MTWLDFRPQDSERLIVRAQDLKLPSLLRLKGLKTAHECQRSCTLLPRRTPNLSPSTWARRTAGDKEHNDAGEECCIWNLRSADNDWGYIGLDLDLDLRSAEIANLHLDSN
jgi:hypothetical protein